MIDKVKQYISKEELINVNDKIIAGISGGADSICLLCVLRHLQEEYKLDITAVHINHGIRETAMRDQMHTEMLCNQFGIEFYAVKCDVTAFSKENHLSTEEAGRILRYKTFEDIADKKGYKNYKIAIAHNMDDNAETMLLNMVRGSGIKGMSGILPKRGNIIRPLLCLSRNEIEEYLQKQELSFCTDETNLSDDYSRNKIRHHVLPVLKDINVNCLERFSELSAQVTEAEEYLNIKTQEALENASYKDDDGSIHIKSTELLSCHEYIRKRVLLEAFGEIANRKKDIGAVHVNILYNLFSLQVGRKVMLPYDVVATKEYDGIVLRKEYLKAVEQKAEATVSIIPGEMITFNRYELCASVKDISKDETASFPRDTFVKWFDYDKILMQTEKTGKPLVVRNRNDNDFIVISKDGAVQKLKKYFVNEKIDSTLRDTIPLLAIENDIIWILGHRTSTAYNVDETTGRILEISYKMN